MKVCAVAGMCSSYAGRARAKPRGGSVVPGELTCLGTRLNSTLRFSAGWAFSQTGGLPWYLRW